MREAPDTPQDSAPPHGQPSSQDLANAISNPAAPVTSLQFRDIYIPSVPGAKGAANSLQIQPVLPIGPFPSLPFVQLVKVTLPLSETLPAYDGPGGTQAGASGLGDLQIFDLVSIKAPWGRWGVGATLTAPTASSDQLGAGKWQAGPAFAFMYTGVPNLTVGAIFQNPISFAGSSSRPSVSQMLVSPTLTYSYPSGWFVGMSDFNWSFDWRRGGAATIPIGVQVGKVVRIGKQPVSIAFEVARMAALPSGTPNPGWIFGFEFTPIFNFHIGPKQKIHLRG